VNTDGPRNVSKADFRRRECLDGWGAEHQMRPVCLGKKNYLFCGSDAGGERAAVIYTAMATCKLAGAEPWAYLSDVLPELARHARR
jgi:transposase